MILLYISKGTIPNRYADSAVDTSGRVAPVH